MPFSLTRLAFAVAFSVAVVSAVAIAQGQAQAPAQPPKVTNEPPKTFGKWALRCTVAEGGARSCLLNQVFIQGQTKKLVLRLSVIRKKTSNTDSLVIVAPLGVDLAKSPAFTVPGVAIGTTPYKFCGRDGCYSEVAISPALLAEMRKGGQGQVSFTAFGDGKPVALTVSFEGFADGYAALLASQ